MSLSHSLANRLFVFSAVDKHQDPNCRRWTSFYSVHDDSGWCHPSSVSPLTWFHCSIKMDLWKLSWGWLTELTETSTNDILNWQVCADFMIPELSWRSHSLSCNVTILSPTTPWLVQSARCVALLWAKKRLCSIFRELPTMSVFS